MLLDVQHWQLGFTKSSIVAEIALSLSRTLKRGQLSLDRFEFWLPTSQPLVLGVFLRDAFT
ncbi:DUF645 family protein [Vibrio cholerae]|uniref:DUF645 family protein n=1 Tax=Vibrio cholerae TaxID=666 RepID=UPI0028944F0A|nr:DUF645 family protein [Vibrio cholerae]ELI0377296.1 DUF645 family protein [Vibrio cholerae]